MIASYCSLAVAILVGTDQVRQHIKFTPYRNYLLQKLADQVRQLLPDKQLTPMMDQLERFLDFMRITVKKNSMNGEIEDDDGLKKFQKLKENTVNNIERVLNSFQIAASTSAVAD